jgi:pimeloyl-ACP methyl ester carboxylesterase
VTDVVYVHGLWMPGEESLVLRRRLVHDFGLRFHALRYSAAFSSMDAIADALQELVQGLKAQELHMVGHSLGGLVIHRFFERYPAQPPGRVVFMGTPSLASRAAQSARRLLPIEPLMGRSVAEELLAPKERRWPHAARPLGIIAGTQPFGVGQLLAQFEEDNDGTVAVSETRMAGASAHLLLPVSHLGMLLSARAAHEVGHFLSTGGFTAR